MANKKGQNEKILTIPAGTVKIENEAYKDRTDITGVVIPDTVTEIGWSAFSGCTVGFLQEYCHFPFVHIIAPGQHGAA